MAGPPAPSLSRSDSFWNFRLDATLAQSLIQFSIIIPSIKSQGFRVCARLCRAFFLRSDGFQKGRNHV